MISPTTSPAPVHTSETPGAAGTEKRGFQRYLELARPLRHFMGLTTTGWSSGSPDEIKVYPRGKGWEMLAKNVLEDTINGSTLVYKSRDDGTGVTPPDGYSPFWERRDFMANAVAALPGVIDYKYHAIMPGQPITHVEFTTTDAAASKLADAMVKDVIHGMDVIFSHPKSDKA